MLTKEQKRQKQMEKECRQFARELVREQYQLYDAIWYGRMRITPQLFEHGADIVKTINTIMPNLLTYNEHVNPLDLVAEQFGFETPSGLVEYLLAYKPRRPLEEHYFEHFLAEYQAAEEKQCDNPFEECV